MGTVKILGVAVVHFIFTAAAIYGAFYGALETLRAGLTSWPTHATALRQIAVVLAWPASAVLGQLKDGSPWFWPIIGINSLLWALVLMFAWKLYRARNRAKVA